MEANDNKEVKEETTFAFCLLFFGKSWPQHADDDDKKKEWRRNL